MPIKGARAGDTKEWGRARGGAEKVATVEGKPEDGVARVVAEGGTVGKGEMEMVDVGSVQEGEDVTDDVGGEVRQGER